MIRELLFKRINNALLDMQASTSQTFEPHYLTFARLLTDSSLQPINERLAVGLDVEQFLENGSNSRGGMHGSAQLAWPVEIETVLGLQWLLIQKMAGDPSQLLVIAHTFYTVGPNLTRELHSLTRQLLIPFTRDYKDFVTIAEEAPVTRPSISTNGGGVSPEQQVNFNITGVNARINYHSNDYSVNTLTFSNEILNHLKALRDAIDGTPLSVQQKAEAIEVVGELEAQIASGNPRKRTVSALLAALPAIEAITSIGKILYDLLSASGMT